MEKNKIIRNIDALCFLTQFFYGFFFKCFSSVFTMGHFILLTDLF